MLIITDAYNNKCKVYQAFLFKKRSMSTWSGVNRLLFSQTSSPAAEKSCSDGTEVAGIQRKIFTTSIMGRKLLSLFLERHNSKGSDFHKANGRAKYCLIIIITLAEALSPCPPLAALLCCTILS